MYHLLLNHAVTLVILSVLLMINGFGAEGVLGKVALVLQVLLNQGT